MVSLQTFPRFTSTLIIPYTTSIVSSKHVHFLNSYLCLTAMLRVVLFEVLLEYRKPVGL